MSTSDRVFSYVLGSLIAVGSILLLFGRSDQITLGIVGLVLAAAVMFARGPRA